MHIHSFIRICFPSLRYLHAISSPENAYIYTQYAPNLTHLRFPSRGGVCLQLFRAIQFALKPDDASTEFPDQASSAMLPPPPFKLTRKLEKVFIEGCIDWPTQIQPSPRDLLGPDEKKKIILVDSAPSTPDPGDSLQRVERRDWEERIIGGPGCWAEPS